MRVFETLSRIGVVPVVKIDRADDAVKLADTLLAGGLPCAEITFRTDAAEDSIRLITESRPEMVVGAGLSSLLTRLKSCRCRRFIYCEPGL